MALTKSLKELMQSRVARDPDFAAALLREGIDTKLTGDVATSKAILRDYIKATAGFEKLGHQPRACSGCSARAAIPGRAMCPASSVYLQQQVGIERHTHAGAALGRATIPETQPPAPPLPEVTDKRTRPILLSRRVKKNRVCTFPRRSSG
jgi:hypothetical protein